MQPAQKYTYPHNNGFTLIELLVTVVIMVITLGIGIAGFLRFNDRQQVETAAKEIQTLIRTAQAKAQIREVPTQTCASLRDYRVTNNGGTTEYTIRCNGGNEYTRGSYSIPSGISADNFTVDFAPLHGGALLNESGATDSLPITVRNSDSSIQYQFTVHSSGTITDGGFVDP